jgi:tetratricopeptide (TPR) repeat protein
MLGLFGETWVLDWGLAKDIHPIAGHRETNDEPTHAVGATPPRTMPVEEVIGTPGFIAPELARGEFVGPAADIYALGVALGTMLVGRPPLAREAVADWLGALAGVPPTLLAIARKAAADDSTNRYADPRELAADIERWVTDEPTTAFRDPFPVRAWRWARRHRTRVTAAVALLLAAVPLAVALALVSEDAREQAVNDAKRISDEKAEADRQRVRAEQNLTLVEGLAGDVVERVIDNPRLKEADLVETRGEIAAQVLGTYRRAAAQRGDDPVSAAGVARADRLSGVIARERGRHTEAVAAFRRAEAALVVDQAAALDLGVVRVELGRALYELGRPTEAAEALIAARRGLEGHTRPVGGRPRARARVEQSRPRSPRAGSSPRSGRGVPGS